MIKVPMRTVSFQTWLTNGYRINAEVTGNCGGLSASYANGELAFNFELTDSHDARNIAAALLALAEEWENNK